MARKLRAIQTSEALENCVKELSNHSIIGLDTETTWDPNEPGAKTNLSIIQLAINQGEDFLVYIIDCLARTGKKTFLDVTPLKTIFEDTEKVKVIHNASFDVNVLLRCKSLLLNNVWCTQIGRAHAELQS